MKKILFLFPVFFINLLFGGPTSEMEDQYLEVKKNPGLHSPIQLLNAGFYFLEKEDFDTAAMLYIGALGRENIEMNFDKVPVSERSTLSSLYCDKLVELFNSGFFQPKLIIDQWFMSGSNLPINRNLYRWKTSVKNAKPNFEKWDRETPRSYREFSDLNLLQETVERYYRIINGKENAEDYLRLSDDDQYYYDPENRTYYLTDPALSFVVPTGFKPTIGLRDKLDGFFRVDDDDSAFVDVGCFLGDSFQNDYQDRVLNSDNEEEVFEIENYGIPFYRVRTYCEGSTDVENDFYIQRDLNHTFMVSLDCLLEEEEVLLKKIREMIFSIKFI